MKLVQMNDESVIQALNNQWDEQGSRHDGGIRSDFTGIPSPSHGGTAGYMASMAAALVTQESRFYHDEKLLFSLDKAVSYMLRKQHKDGTISLGGTNFNSPPDTGFVVTGLSQIYHLLNNNTWKSLKPVVDKIKMFLTRTIPALLTGGCHTPNHRWVMTAALGSLYEIFKREDLVKRADEWLAEGMDRTKDGEWTERSNGIYNTVSDIMLFYTAKYLNRPELLEHVRKNLNMMIYMIHPNGEVVTDYSGRQDFGVLHDLSEYFLSYRLMADLDQNPLFASMFDLVSTTMTRLGPVNNHAMLGYLMFPSRMEHLNREPLPEQYTKIFNEQHPIVDDLQKMNEVGHHSQIQHSSMHTSFGAPIVRYRDKETSITAMTRTPSFFSLRHGNVKLLGVSISTMFTPGIVEMEQFSVTDSGYQMKTIMEKGYHGPVPKESLPNTTKMEISPWYLLPHHLRPQTHVQQQQIMVEMIRKDRDWQIAINSDDREDVLMQVSFMFSQDCHLSGDGLDCRNAQTTLWMNDKLRCSSGEDWIDISSGQMDHNLLSIHNSPIENGVQRVVVNLLSPVDKLFNIHLSNRSVSRGR